MRGRRWWRWGRGRCVCRSAGVLQNVTALAVLRDVQVPLFILMRYTNAERYVKGLHRMIMVTMKE